MRRHLGFPCTLLTAIALVTSTNAFTPCNKNHLQHGNRIYNNVKYFDNVVHQRSKMRAPSSSQNCALKMVSVSGATIAAITSAISGGLFSGGLHAIAGPDHLAALLPRCVGQRWFRAGKVGAVWGIGHGVSATILGVLAFGLKNRVQHNMGPGLRSFLSGASHATEIAVGLSIVLIGLMGIKEAREWEDEMVVPPPQSLSSAVAEAGIKSTQKRAIFFNGLLHGFSWDGAPSLAPALAVATWSGNLAFLSAYVLGTMSTMAVATTLIGEGTRRAGQIFQRPDLPQKLSLVSSFVAIAVGLFWFGLALS